MITFRCECGKQLQAKDEYEGKRTRCPSCGLEAVIPSAAIQREPAAPRPPAQDPVKAERPKKTAVSRRRWGDDEEEDGQAAPVREGTSRKAVISLVLGILSIGCSVFTAIPAVILGLLGLRDIGNSGGRLQGRGLAIGGIVTGIVGTLISLPLLLLGALLIPAVQKVRDAATRMESANNLKQIAIGMHNYNATNNRLPPAVVYDRTGKPLYSWRVLLLPYVGEDNLYNQFHLDEPWDSPHNSQLLAHVPKVYAPPKGMATKEPNGTYYQLFNGPGSPFDSDLKRFPLAPFSVGGRQDATWASSNVASIPRSFTDGTSNTFMVVEAADAVPWSKPEDLAFDPNQPLPKLGGHFAGGFNAAMADGAVRFVQKGTDEKAIRASVTGNGGEMIFLP